MTGAAPSSVRPGPRLPARGGMTLLEVLLAMSLTALAFTIIWLSFRGTIEGWRSGSAMVDRMHQGDFLSDQIASALRSAAWFQSRRGEYGLWFEDGEQHFPADRLSWVTASSALLPSDSPYARGLHRLELAIEENDRGVATLAVRAWSPVATEEDPEEIEPIFPAPRVRGLNALFWAGEEDGWVEEWTETNKVPGRVALELYMDPEGSGDDEPLVVRRWVEIPVAGVATQAVSQTSTPAPAR